MITREDFHINVLFTTVQGVAAALVATQLVGRLGHYAVTLQPTTLIVAIVAATFAAVVENRFWHHRTDAGYLALPFGVFAGVAAHYALIPTTPFTAILGLKEVIVLTGALIAARFAFNTLLPYFDSAERAALKLAGNVRTGVRHVAEEAQIVATRTAEKAKEAIHSGARKVAEATE